MIKVEIKVKDFLCSSHSHILISIPNTTFQILFFYQFLFIQNTKKKSKDNKIKTSEKKRSLLCTIFNRFNVIFKNYGLHLAHVSFLKSFFVVGINAFHEQVVSVVIAPY